MRFDLGLWKLRQNDAVYFRSTVHLHKCIVPPFSRLCVWLILILQSDRRDFFARNSLRTGSKRSNKSADFLIPCRSHPRRVWSATIYFRCVSPVSSGQPTSGKSVYLHRDGTAGTALGGRRTNPGPRAGTWRVGIPRRRRKLERRSRSVGQSRTAES